MRILFVKFYSALKKWYFFQELKDISRILLVLGTLWSLYYYGKTIADFVFSNTGMIYSTFFCASLVIGIAIKIYYRIMVIKYHEKDTNIQLFQTPHQSN